jgi:hypothetical protein
MDEIFGKQLIEWQTYYCYSFMEAVSVKRKRTKIKILYSQKLSVSSQLKAKMLLVITRDSIQTG